MPPAFDGYPLRFNSDSSSIVLATDAQASTSVLHPLQSIIRIYFRTPIEIDSFSSTTYKRHRVKTTRRNITGKVSYFTIRKCLAQSVLSMASARASSRPR